MKEATFFFSKSTFPIYLFESIDPLYLFENGNDYPPMRNTAYAVSSRYFVTLS